MHVRARLQSVLDLLLFHDAVVDEVQALDVVSVKLDFVLEGTNDLFLLVLLDVRVLSRSLLLVEVADNTVQDGVGQHL